MRSSPRSMLVVFSTLIAVSVADAADLRFAHGLYRDKRYQLAADEYKSFLDANPGDPKANEARYYLAESLVQLQRLTDAAAAYEQVSSTDRNYRKAALFRAGTIRKRSGEIANAERSLERFVVEFPDEADAPGAWLLLAECRLASKKTDAARHAIQKARPNIEEGSRWWGRLQLVDVELLKLSGKNAKAINALNALAASRDPLAAEAALRLGTVLFAERKFAEAAASFDRTAATSKDANVVRQAKYNAGLAFIELKQWTEAGRRLAPIFEVEIPESNSEAARLIAQAGQAMVQARLGAGDRAGARSIVEDALRRFGNAPSAWEFKRLGAEIDLADGRTAEAAATFKSLLRDAPANANRSELIASACRAAAVTSDADWATSLLRELGAESGAVRRNAERVLSETEWKDATVIERLLSDISDSTAKARLNYRLAALELEATQPAKAVERLQSIRRTPDLPADLKSNTDYVLGGALVQLSRWSEALEPLEQFLQTRLEQSASSDDASVLTAARWWARCLTWLSDADAQKHLESMLRFERRSLFETVASSIAAERRSELALWLLGKLPPPESRAAAVIAARCLVELKKPQEALRKLRAPIAPEERYLAGVAYLLLNNPEQVSKGRSQLQQVADSDPPSAWSLDAALRLAGLATTPEEAAECERRLSRLASSARGADLRRLRLELAFLAAQAGKTLQAIADLNTFIEREKATPEAVEAALKLAELHEARGETVKSEQALAMAEQLDSVQSASGPLLFRRASLAYRSKNWDKAEALLSEYLAKFSKEESSPAASLMLAEVALERQRADEAVRRFMALKESDDAAIRATATLRLAQAMILGRKFDDAERVANEFLHLEGQSDGRKAEAHFVRGRALMNRAKFSEARTALEKAAAQEGTELAAKARFMVGETYFHQQNYEAAMKEYLRLAVLGHDDEWRAAALLQVGKCHEKLGNDAAAADDYRRAVEQFPSAPAAKQAKERLEQLRIGARKSDRNGVKE
jgi:cellulose synthase operon protein C